MNSSTLSNEALDRLIHEQVMGEHKHEFAEGSSSCWHCGLGRTFIKYPRYCTSWEDYGRLLEKIKGHIDFYYFTEKLFCYKWLVDGNFATCTHEAIGILLDKRRGCEAIAEYFCKEEKC